LLFIEVKTMKKSRQKCPAARKRSHVLQPVLARSKSKGQALVEFTLIFIILLVVAWIPADFGLAMYTGQLAQNAAREGARIAAADPNVAGQVGTCTVRVDCNTTPGSVMDEVSKRIASALMPSTTVQVTLDGGTACDRQVHVQVNGGYSFFFYRILRMLGANVPGAVSIVRQTDMRWEHQCV
jgi:type IV secretory pathway TrbD component